MSEENLTRQAGAKDKPKTGFRFLKFIPLLLLLLLVLGCAYLGFMFLEQEKAISVLSEQQNYLSQQNSAKAQELSSLQNDLSAVSANTATVNDLLVAQKIQVEELTRELISTRLRINDNGGIANQLWTLEEAESLLRIAQQRLIVAKDTRSALALYVASDEILKQINDPAIFSIRSILASDMAALRAVQTVDVEGIYLELDVLSQGIDSLQVNSGIDGGIDRKLDGADNIFSESDSESFWDSLLGYLGTFVIVQKADETIPPLLSNEQRFNVKQNIKLQLEQAKIALLQENESVYQNSIENALANIGQYLEPAGTQKQSIESSLATLLATTIVVQVPAVSNSLVAIQQIIPLSEGQALEVSE